MNGKNWFVIEAHEGAGGRAQLALCVAGLEVWRPVDFKRRGDRGRHRKPQRDIPVPRFGRYFFVRCAMSAPLLDAIRHTNGVAEILRACGTNEPVAVPDEQIAWLKVNKLDDKAVENFPAKGDRIRIKGGPFMGFEGVVRQIDKRGVLSLDVDMFGRLAPLILEASHVEIVTVGGVAAISTSKHRAA
jgi:transcription antitermination factor NusG